MGLAHAVELDCLLPTFKLGLQSQFAFMSGYMITQAVSPLQDSHHLLTALTRLEDICLSWGQLTLLQTQHASSCSFTILYY